MKKILSTAILVLALTSLSPLIAEESNKIKIIKNDWSSQIVLSIAVGKILTSMGYDVDYVTLNTQEQWGALTRGMAHIQLEVWEGTMSEDLSRFLIRDHIKVAKTYNIPTREEWWFPEYVKEKCPGLPNWKALNQCSHLFAEKEGGKGIYFAGPWEKPDEQRVRALGLNYKVVKLKDGDELKRKLLDAVKAKRPILLFNWTPNWVDVAIKGSFVDFPDYSPECETDPQWGVNKTFLHDCGNPKKGWLKVVVWKNMQKKWPCAFRFLENLELTTLDLGRMAYSIDFEKKSYEQAANEWVNKNRNRWLHWISPNCRTAK